MVAEIKLAPVRARVKRITLKRLKDRGLIEMQKIISREVRPQNDMASITKTISQGK
jgi:hypothetical protein